MPTDWALEITKFTLTPVLAGAGAYIGFILSNRSKKHEILYKEKLESFKKLSSELLKLRYMTIVCLLGDELQEDYRIYSVEESESFLRNYERRLYLLDEDPTIFLSKRTRKSFEILKISLRETMNARSALASNEHQGWLSLIQNYENAGRSDDSHLSALNQYGRSLGSLKDTIEDCINAIYIDLGLPNLTSRFESERTVNKEKLSRALKQATEIAATTM